MSKRQITIAVDPLTCDDEIEGACDDARCFLEEVRTSKGTDDGMLSDGKRAQSARWLAETALALALHFEAQREPLC